MLEFMMMVILLVVSFFCGFAIRAMECKLLHSKFEQPIFIRVTMRNHPDMLLVETVPRTVDEVNFILPDILEVGE